jgi:hypothetical protein
MEPQFQTSFIPKKADSSGPKLINAQEPVSIFSIISNIILVVVIFASIGLFLYQRSIDSQIISYENKIVEAKDAFQPDTVKKLVYLSNQISFTKKLLDSHIAVSQLFDKFQTLLVKTVRLNNFMYSNTNGLISIKADGESKSYGALVQQSDIFQQSGLMNNIGFFNFNIAEDGNVAFNFGATVDQNALLYKNLIQDQAAVVSN